MNFSFASAGQVKFGNGVSSKIDELIPNDLNRLFIVTGSSPHRHTRILDRLQLRGFEIEVFSIKKEPDIETIDQATRNARFFKTDAVIAIGGGSVIDAGKAIAALIKNKGPLLDYLENVGKGQPLTKAGVPMMAIPTTAGTGSEVTQNSVISVPEFETKVSLRHPTMIPYWAVVDPELTYDLPLEIASYTGMDALIQCIEAFISINANPLTDGIASQGIKLAISSIIAACGPNTVKSAKTNMCAASLCSGLALANAKLGAVHGFAGPIGGMIDAPHGAICSSLLIPVWKANYAALSQRLPHSPQLLKMDTVARIITGNPEATGNYASASFEKLLADLPIKSLGKLGFGSEQIETAVEKAANSSSMKGNSIVLTQHELKDILDAAI